MSRACLCLCRMFAEQQTHSVVKGSDIWDADDKVSTYFKYARHFMYYPEKLFNMLKNLIGDNDVEAFRGKGQFTCFKVALPNLRRLL